MGLTQFSFILLPLCIIWFTAPAKLLQLMAVVGIFEAAAALTFGGLGVQPGLVPALTFMGYMSLQVLLGARFPGQAHVLGIIRPFLVVAAWALVSSFLMPWWFEGKAYVWPQKSLPPFVLATLAPNPSNINQDFYLIINCLATITMSTFFASRQTTLIPFLRAYLMSGFLAGFIALWQFASRVAGLPFPEDFFYSNPGWAILTAQTIGAVPRINGSFPEPAAMASYMGAIVFASGWLLLQGHRERYLKTLFVFSFVIMMLSTSTTGFAMLAVAGGGITVSAVLTGSTRMMSAIAKIGLPLIILFFAVGVSASVFIPDLNKNIELVYNATINKQQSSSYEDRTGADLDSLVAMLDTYGLGVGWGSNRSSSLLPGLLAAIGVPGVFGLLWFGFGLAGKVRRARRTGTPEQSFVMDGCCGALIGYLLSGLIAGPSITSVTFFFLLSLLVGSVCQVMQDVRPGMVIEADSDGESR